MNSLPMQHSVALYCAKIAGRVNGSGETTAWSSNHSCIIVRTWQLLKRPKDKMLNNIACSSLPRKPELMEIEWVSGWYGTLLPSDSTSLQGVALDRLAPTIVSSGREGANGETEIKFLAEEPHSP